MLTHVHLFAVSLRAVYTLDNEFIKKKNGHEYIKVNKFNIKLTPGKSYINFENLFDGDKRLSESLFIFANLFCNIHLKCYLGDQMNVILNENANDIVNELGQSIEDTFGEISKQISNMLFQTVPYKNIFPLEETSDE